MMKYKFVSLTKLAIMNQNIRYILLGVICAALITTSINAQTEKEIIIIEKTLDSNGNIISSNITRKSGDISENEIQELINKSKSSQRFDFRQFPGFDENSFFEFPEQNTDEKASIGVYLSFDNGRTFVSDVVPGSGAQEADIRKGDEIIAVNGIPVGSMADIQDIIKDKKSGDEVRIKVFRDGKEMEKIVKLSNRRKSFPLIVPEGESFRQFFFDPGKGGGLGLDSLLDLNRLFREFDIEPMFPGGGQNESANIRSRAQLGVYVDDGDGLIITEVLPGSAAEKSGILPGDHILRFDDQLIGNYDDLSKAISAKKPGDKIELEILRKGKKSKFSVILK